MRSDAVVVRRVVALGIAICSKVAQLPVACEIRNGYMHELLYINVAASGAVAASG
jgi:hypothetical protein